MSGSEIPVERFAFISVASALNSCIFYSIVLLLLCFLFRTKKVLNKIGPACMIVLLLSVVIRMFIPVEFSFTHSIYVEDILTKAYRVFVYPIIDEPFIFKVWHLLIVIWTVGAVINLLRRLIEYKQFVRLVWIMDSKSWDEVAASYNLDSSLYKGMEHVRLVYTKFAKSPSVIGFRKPCIVLPDIVYTEKQFKYIIAHELMHVRKKDIVWKILVDVLCICFWWNPAFYLLRKELFKLIEMRNDMEIIKNSSEEEAVAYMESLTETVFQLAGKNISFSVGFNDNNFKEVKQRMELIAQKDKFSRAEQVLLCAFVAVMIAATACVIIVPHSELKRDDTADNGTVTRMDEDNTYLIVNGDSYDVYVGGEYLFTTSDLIGLEDLKIYESLEDVNNE